mgnify:CR=1 FL=1
MKISVITVCYNSIATLQDTLESILRQTYPDMESIVVDGASKDGTVELIEKYSHQFSGRMKWLSEPDKGIYDAMNKGISMLRFIEKNHISTAYIDRDMVFMRTGGSSTAGLRAILRNTRQNKQAFRKNNLPYPWHYGVTRLLAKAGSTRNPIHYLFKTR